MIRITIHRQFADGSPSLSISFRRRFKVFERAADAAALLLAEETRQPGCERVAEYVITYQWDSGCTQRDYYRAAPGSPPEYLRSEHDAGQPGRAMGRCPDCGEAVEVAIRMHEPGRVLPHGCPARICEYPDCHIIALPEGMVQFADGPWYCPSHALLLVSKTLVLLTHGGGDVDWPSVRDLIAGTLPHVIRKVEEGKGYPRRLDRTPH
jgi:hypothetical protein